MSSALNMYNEIMDDTSQCNSEEPRWTSVGHFMRAEVLFNMLGLFFNDDLKVFAMVDCVMCRHSGVWQRDGRTRMKPPETCCAVLSVHSSSWSAAIMHPIPWMI